MYTLQSHNMYNKIITLFQIRIFFIFKGDLIASSPSSHRISLIRNVRDLFKKFSQSFTQFFDELFLRIIVQCKRFVLKNLSRMFVNNLCAILQELDENGNRNFFCIYLSYSSLKKLGTTFCDCIYSDM